MITLVCQQCGASYQRPPYRAAKSKYCSNACHAKAKTTKLTRNCKQCGSQFTTHVSADASYCSHACSSKSKKQAVRVIHHPLYVTWLHMLSRCSNPKSISFPRYGGRGVTVCDRWRNDFWAFVEDMGDRPEGMTLDRIHNDGNYEPSNCRWADQEIQQNNRRDNHFLTWQGKTQTISEWSREVGIHRRTLASRINLYGWSIERTLSTPARSRAS